MSGPLATRTVGRNRRSRDELRDAKGRRAVLLFAVPALILKLILAWRTGGTGDVKTWEIFAAGVREKGPIGVYSINFEATSHRLYNHPPLVGWLLELINALSSCGIPLRFSLRAIASIADVGSALLAFEIVRRRLPMRRAIAAGMMVGASPVLVLISGYHGNTDPIFGALVLLGTFLLVDKDKAATAGVSLALATSVKIVPLVVLPALLVFLFKYRRNLLKRTALAYVVVILALWAGPVLTEWHAIKDNVIGYSGVASRQWGLVQIFRVCGQQGVVQFLNGPGTGICGLFACLVPAVLVWRRSDLPVQGVCLSLVLFLALSPAFGVQYLSWPLAAACILDLWFGALLNIVAGIFLFLVYTNWNDGLSWTKIARGEHLTSLEVDTALVVWFILIGFGGYQLFRAARTPVPATGPPSHQVPRR